MTTGHPPRERVIRVGASGWSHPEWVGPVYPVHLRDRPEAWLPAYADRLRSVELTSPFHAPVDEDLVASWSRAGVELLDQGEFEFSLQVPRDVTHDALPAGDVDRAWEATARFERTVLDPLSDEGLLGAVLLRFPPTHAPTAGAARNLREVLTALPRRAIALDFGDPAWRTSPHGRDVLRLPDVAIVESTREPPVPGARHGYLRPSSGDVAWWAQRARAHEAMDREVRVVFTDAGGGRAAADAIALRHELGEARDVPLPRLTAQTRLEL